MQGLITIDFGNSNPHAGIFLKHQSDWKLIKVVPWSELPIHLEQLKLNPTNSSLVLCEVKAREDDLIPYINQGFLLTRVKSYWKGKRFAGMPVSYATTLGEDRLIEAFYVYKKLKEPSLIIDAGTFLTMDVVTQEGFRGGYIIPGVSAYSETFKKGEQLKETVLNSEVSWELPQATQEAMRDSYTAFAALAQKLLHEHKLTKIHLTGGNALFWERLLQLPESGVDVQVQADLIHLALHFWMTTQIEPL